MFALQLSNLGFSPLLPSIQQEFAMSYTQLGTFTGIYGLLAMVLSVPAGVSARRFGERRVLALGLLGVAAGSLLLGQAWSVESAIAFRGLTIFGYRFAFVSVLIAVALTAPPALRGRTMGVVGATSSLASVIGAPLGGIAGARVHLADRDPRIRRHGGARRRRVLAVLSPVVRRRPGARAMTTTPVRASAR